MARIRSIKPEFWTDGRVVSLAPEARLLFIGSWNFARCDQGHLDDDATALKLKVLPADDVDADALIEELIAKGLVDRYKADGRSFLHIRRFTEHQKIETRWNSRCPYCPLQDSANLAETPPTTVQEGKGGDRRGRERKVKPTSPPSEVDADLFQNFWDLYPRRNGKRLSRGKAERIWWGLKPEQKTAAIAAAKHYAAACNSGITIAADAFRWLRDRSFEDWQEPATPTPQNGKPDPTSRAGTTAYLPYVPSEPDPACEHSDPICDTCRRANLARLKDLIGEAVG